MKISSKGRYAVRIMADIASCDKEVVSLSEVATRQNLSVKYLEKIMSSLTKAKLLDSVMGSQGGYKLSKNPKNCTVAEVLAATGDLPELAPCQKNNGVCPQKNKCSASGCWDNLTKIIYDYLKSVSIFDIINKTY